MNERRFEKITGYTGIWPKQPEETKKIIDNYNAVVDELDTLKVKYERLDTIIKTAQQIDRWFPCSICDYFERCGDLTHNFKCIQINGFESFKPKIELSASSELDDNVQHGCPVCGNPHAVLACTKCGWVKDFQQGNPDQQKGDE